MAELIALLLALSPLQSTEFKIGAAGFVVAKMPLSNGPYVYDVYASCRLTAVSFISVRGFVDFQRQDNLNSWADFLARCNP